MNFIIVLFLMILYHAVSANLRFFQNFVQFIVQEKRWARMQSISQRPGNLSVPGDLRKPQICSVVFVLKTLACKGQYRVFVRFAYLFFYI